MIRSIVDFEVFDIVTNPFVNTYNFIFCSEVLYYLHLNQLRPITEKIITALHSKGIILLVHSRSLKDDSSGLNLKEYGAKTIHEHFIKHPLLSHIDMSI